MGKALIDYFISKTAPDALITSLLYTAAPHLRPESFQVELLSKAAIPEMHVVIFRIIYHYIRMPHAGRVIENHSRMFRLAYSTRGPVSTARRDLQWQQFTPQGGSKQSFTNRHEYVLTFAR